MANAVDDRDLPLLKWGVIGCGRVSHDFCLALQRHVQSASVVACATSNSLQRAQDFAQLHSIQYAYCSYDELLANDDVQIVYVGNVHCFRREIGQACIQAGKHVLLEKPFTCKLEDAKYLIDLAKKKGVLLMEGLWTRFFPAVEKARQLLPEIGTVVNVTSDFNFNANDSEVYPDSPVYNRRLGGGATLLTSPYPLSMALMAFSGQRPTKVHVVGQVDPATGVDLQAAMILEFAGDTTTTSYHTKNPVVPGAGIATLSYGVLCESREETNIVGTKGSITIHSPCHCPTRLTLRIKQAGRANVETKVYEYPLPVSSSESTTDYYYPNSAGFCYEAAAVARCIASNMTSCPQFTLDETLVLQELMEQVRLQLGVKEFDE